MFDQYTVLVKVALNNQVSRGLLMMGGQFTKLNQQAAAFEARLKNIKSLAFVGAGMAAAGFFGLHLLSKAIKPAEEYAHQINILNMAGLKQKEIAEAVGVAWSNSGKVITSSATENLRMLNDMRIVFGKMDEAQKALPLVTQMQAVLMSSKEGKEAASDKNFAFSVAKALDIIGAVRNKEEFEKEAVMMAKTVTAFQGRVTPAMFQGTFAYARQAKYALDNEFKYELLPTLMMEYAQSTGGAGGGSRGVGPMLAAMYRFTNQGYINKKSLPELISLGLVDKNSSLKTTTTGTTVGPMKDYQLAGRNPLLWVTQTLVPALEKKYGSNLTREQLQFHINQIARGNQLAASLITEFAVKSYAFFRDQKLIRQAMTPEQAYQRALINDPTLAHLAVKEQWENVQVALTTPLVTVLLPALIHLATGLNFLANILIKYPALASTLSYGFLALSASLAFGGTVLLLTAAFRGLALTFTLLTYPILALSLPVLGIAAAVGLLTYAAYKAWTILSNMNWSELWKEVVAGLSMIWQAIKSFFSGAAMSTTDMQKIGSKGYTPTLDATPGQPTNAALNRFGIDPAKGNAANKTIQVHSTVQLNKDVVARAVTDHVVKEASKVPNNSSRFDIGMTPTPNMLKLGSY